MYSTYPQIIATARESFEVTNIAPSAAHRGAKDPELWIRTSNAMHDAPPRARCASVIFTNSVIADLHHHVLSPAALPAAFRRHDCLTARSTHTGCVCMYVFVQGTHVEQGRRTYDYCSATNRRHGRAVGRLRDMARASRLGAQCGGFLAL